MTVIAALDPFDTFTYAVIGPISMAASFLLMLAHVWYKELREKPGDLILMIAVSEFFLSLHWTMSAVYSDWITHEYDDESMFCHANSYIAVIAASMDSLTNIWLMCYIWLTVRGNISLAKLKQRYFHLISVVLTALLVYLKRNQLGRNSNGTCSTKLNVQDMVTGSILILFLIIFSTYVYHSTKKSLAFQGPQHSKLRRDFLNYYGDYIKALVTISTLYFLSSVVQVTVKIVYHSTYIGDIRGPWGVALNLSKIGNCVKVLMPTLMFFIRIRDPLLSKLVFKPLRRDTLSALRSHRDTLLSKGRLTVMKLAEQGNENSDNSDTDSPLKQQKAEAWKNELLTLEDHAELGWMNLVPSRQKENYGRTMMAVLYNYFAGNMWYQSGLYLGDSTKLTKRAVKELDSCQIDGEKMKADLGITDSILNCTATFFAPRLFKRIIETSRFQSSFKSSLSLESNSQILSKLGKSQAGDGGASGELMICTHDSKLIIKTITRQEFKVFKDIVFDYCNYVVNNKDTLVCRKFALVEIELTEIGKKVYFVLMENLFWFDSLAILRRYDLKGSSHARQVLPQYGEGQKGERFEKTLKDIDFLNIESEVTFRENLRREDFIEQVQKDSLFFRNHKIIDYSMVLAIVDRSKVDIVDALNKVGPVRLIQTSKEDIVIVAGIIDYFQLFTRSKAAERLFKRVVKCSPNLETSSQPPKRYSTRFIDFVKLYFKYSAMAN